MQVVSESVAESPEADHNPPAVSSNVSTVVQGAGDSQSSRNPAQVLTTVPTNVFTRTLQGTLGFTTSQVRVLVEDIYDTQDELLCWKFTDLKYWCYLKPRIPVIRGSISFRYRSINSLQALDWWVIDLMIRG